MKGLPIIVHNESTDDAEHDRAAHDGTGDHGRSPSYGEYSKRGDKLPDTRPEERLHENDLREKEQKCGERVVVKNSGRHRRRGSPIDARG